MGVQNYGPEMLDVIDISALLLGAEFDDVLSIKYHTEYLAHNNKAATYEVVPWASNYSFITPFTIRLRGRVGYSDKDPPGFDREIFMPILENRILRFLELLE